MPVRCISVIMLCALCYHAPMDADQRTIAQDKVMASRARAKADRANLAHNASETKVGPPMKVKHRDNEPTYGGQEHADWNAPTKPNMWPGSSVYGGSIFGGDYSPKDQKIDPDASRGKNLPNAKPRTGSPNYV